MAKAQKVIQKAHWERKAQELLRKRKRNNLTQMIKLDGYEKKNKLQQENARMAKLQQKWREARVDETNDNNNRIMRLKHRFDRSLVNAELFKESDNPHALISTKTQTCDQKASGSGWVLQTQIQTVAYLA